MRIRDSVGADRSPSAGSDESEERPPGMVLTTLRTGGFATVPRPLPVRNGVLTRPDAAV